uniref:Uncharacterized protein n=1 Tax=Oryza punctata TaxID=4537 RepID=A0A0E0KRD2_ORYPU
MACILLSEYQISKGDWSNTYQRQSQALQVSERYSNSSFEECFAVISRKDIESNMKEERH